MTILSRLINKLKYQAETLEQQLQKIDQLPGEQLQAIALSDGDDSLRAAAIACLDYGQVLKDLAFSHTSASLTQKARLRIAILIDEGVLGIQQFSAENTDIMAQLSVVGFCKQPELPQQLLGSITDTQLLYTVALEGVSVKLRELAAARIDDETLLKQLLKKTRGKDKLVYKIVKEKCDGFRERDRLAEQVQREVVELCEQLEAHSRRGFDKLFTPQTNHLQERWQLLEPHSATAIQQRAQQALIVCQQTIEQHSRQQAEFEATESAIANASDLQQAVITDLGQILLTLYSLNDNEGTSQDSELALAEGRQRWSQAIAYKAASDEDKRAFVQLCDGIGFQQQQLAEHGCLPQHTSLLVEQGTDLIHQSLRARLETAQLLVTESTPQAVLTARALLSARDKDKIEQAAAAKNLLRHTAALIRKADSAIQAGESRQAAGIRRSIEEKLLHIDSMPAFLARELQTLDEALGKLLDWKNYAVEPKQQQLIDKMQLLTNSQENPEALATKIKRLQDEWKGISKGSRDQALWESFHQLAQQAYEPCKLYFDAQAQIRKDNLEKRKTLVDQLQAYSDSQQWDTVDLTSINWGGVNTLIGTAIKEWRSYSPIERGPNQTVQLSFDRNLDLLRKQLNDYYQRNAVLKKQLIGKVQALLEQEDNRKAIDEVKRLQTDWKQFGPTARKDEQVLWKAFRSSCDAIFEKRQQLSAEFKAQLNANKGKAKALQLEVKVLLDLSGQELLDAKARVDECQQVFNELGQLPKAEASWLKQSFFNSVDEFASKLIQQRILAKEQVWLDLLEASNKVRLSQLAVAEPEQEQEQLRAAAQNFISNIKKWPKNGIAAIEAKIAEGSGDPSAAENQLALKTLCIRAEILVDKPSPAEDKLLRMDYQVKRLEKGLGQIIPDKKAELNTLLLDWIAVAPVATEVYQPLIERFIDCRT